MGRRDVSLFSLSSVAASEFLGTGKEGSATLKKDSLMAVVAGLRQTETLAMGDVKETIVAVLFWRSRHLDAVLGMVQLISMGKLLVAELKVVRSTTTLEIHPRTGAGSNASHPRTGAGSNALDQLYHPSFPGCTVKRKSK